MSKVNEVVLNEAVSSPSKVLFLPKEKVSAAVERLAESGGIEELVRHQRVLLVLLSQELENAKVLAREIKANPAASNSVEVKRIQEEFLRLASILETTANFG